MQDERDEFVARGPSTRPQKVANAGYTERFTRDALVHAAEQVATGYVKMNVEHLSFLPPIGQWHRAEVEDDDQGESQLLVYGHRLATRSATGLTLPCDNRTSLLKDHEDLEGVTVGVEPRNFDDDVFRDLKTTAPIPVVEHAARSILPPLIWLVTIPVTWGIAQFSGSFLKRLGEAAADGLVAWIAEYSRRAKENSRDNMVEIVFEVANNLTVSAFIELTPSANDSIDDLRRGLDGLSSVANFARDMKDDADVAHVRLVAFFYRDESWHLGWWATEEAAHLTKWFERNYPDPKRFLDGSHFVIADQMSREREPHDSLPSNFIG